MQKVSSAVRTGLDLVKENKEWLAASLVLCPCAVAEAASHQKENSRTYRRAGRSVECFGSHIVLFATLGFTLTKRIESPIPLGLASFLHAVVHAYHFDDIGFIGRTQVFLPLVLGVYWFRQPIMALIARIASVFVRR